MILIADSGSTKTDWVLIKSLEERVTFQSIGLNPLFITDDTEYQLQNVFDSVLNRELVSSVYFFGSGCGTPSRIKVIENFLHSICPGAKIVVESDLLGAAISLFGNNAGIACILGTGSNSGVFDGEKITDKQVSLGYILGDEGSAASMVKNFYKALFYNTLPGEVAEAYFQNSGLSKDDIIDNIYRKPFPNRFLATQLQYIIPIKNDNCVKAIINESLTSFFDIHIKYQETSYLEMGFVGSLAWYFKDEIHHIAKQRGLNVSKIIRYPIDEMVTYYSRVTFSN
ncbi:MAG: hypothetical protein JXA53_10600, partial [Bacteroidales bacterium]|nr:hypothetical protein [Bacteroidales bacterium]